MKEILILFFLVVAQNASFTLVSRARNSKSLLYHLIASIGSNGIWLLVFRNMVVSINDTTLMWTYLVASVLGSIGMHYIAMKFFEKPKKPVEQKPTVGRIVNYAVYNKSTLPAIIVKVHNLTCVDLEVFGIHDRQKTNVTQGSEVFQWSWPVIQK